MNSTEPDKPTSSDTHSLMNALPPSTEPAIKVSDGKISRRARSQASKIESIPSFLRALFSGKFKRTALKKAEITAMRSAASLGAVEKDEILSLALLDRTLNTTRQLLLIAISLDSPAIASQLREFCGEVLRRHPAFKSERLSGVLENHPEATTEDKAIQILVSQDYASLLRVEGNKPTKKINSDLCRSNAVQCLLLWFWATRGLSVERIQRYLQVGLWAPASLRIKTDSEKLRALIATKDPAAASIIYGLLEKQAFEQSQRADAALLAEARAAARACKVEEDLTNVENQLASTKTELDRLAEELQTALKNHNDEKAHLKDDYEQLRGQILRRLKDELSLLDEGMHALRRDPPKIHVMIDHAERAIDGLKLEMGRLRERN